MKRNIKKIIASMLTSAMALGGANIAFAVNLPAPDVAEGYTRYEAEDAELINGANVANFKLENQAGQSNDINTFQQYNICPLYGRKTSGGNGNCYTRIPFLSGGKYGAALRQHSD